MTGDNNGRWNSAKDPKANDWPLDHSLYLSCAADVMRMLRNHPSLLFWCGGNELLPPKNAAGWQLNLIDHKLRDMVSEIDGHRFFVSYGPKPLLSGPWGFAHRFDRTDTKLDGLVRSAAQQQHLRPRAVRRPLQRAGRAAVLPARRRRPRQCRRRARIRNRLPTGDRQLRYAAVRVAAPLPVSGCSRRLSQARGGPGGPREWLERGLELPQVPTPSNISLDPVTFPIKRCI